MAMMGGGNGAFGLFDLVTARNQRLFPGLVLLRQRRQVHAQLHDARREYGVLQLLVELLAHAGHLEIAPELLADLRDDLEGLGEALLAARHADVVPHDLAELAVQLGRSLLAVDREHLVDLGRDVFLRLDELGVVGLADAAREGGLQF